MAKQGLCWHEEAAFLCTSEEHVAFNRKGKRVSRFKVVECVVCGV